MAEAAAAPAPPSATPSPAPSAPAPVVPGGGEAPPRPRDEVTGRFRPNSTDALLEKALARGPQEGDDMDHRAPTPRAQKPPREPPQAPPLPDGTPAPPEVAEALSKPLVDEPEPDNAGTREQPYDITDLPDDRFLRVKIDGKEEVVPFRELADGYLRHQTFSRRVNEAQQVVTQAREIAERALQDREDLRSHFQTWMKSPQEVYQFFMDHSEETLHEVALRYSRQYAREKENPQLRLQRERERNEVKLRSERERLERERSEYEQSRRLEQQTAQARKALEPGWLEGMRQAGFPAVTGEFRATVNGLLTARRQVTGEPLTADDVKNAVVRAAKLLGAETTESRKPAERPSIQPRAPRQAGNGKDWAKIPKYKAKRDPDYWLRNVRGLRD